MISSAVVLATINNHAVAKEFRYGVKPERCVVEDDFKALAIDIVDLFAEQNMRDAELEAKVKAYESIIENSNFKMVVQRKKKEKNG